MPLEDAVLALSRELARVAASPLPAAARLEGAMEILLGALAAEDSGVPGLFLEGWARARSDKQMHLRMAWLREQLRLSLSEILHDGVAAGAFRKEIDPGAMAAVILGAAEGCLLQAGHDGGAVAPERLLRAILGTVTPDQRGLSSIR